MHHRNQAVSKRRDEYVTQRLRCKTQATAAARGFNANVFTEEVKGKLRAKKRKNLLKFNSKVHFCQFSQFSLKAGHPIMFNSLSQTGNGELQLPEGRHTISGAPISALPFAQLNLTCVFIFVLWVLTIRPLLCGISGQWIATKINRC